MGGTQTEVEGHGVAEIEEEAPAGGGPEVEGGLGVAEPAVRAVPANTALAGVVAEVVVAEAPAPVTATTPTTPARTTRITP